MNSLTPIKGLLARLRRARGFSLAETSMAVAITALGIISIMGLMPQGLETSRKTGNMSAQSRIMQNIISDMQNTDWTVLTTNLNQPNRVYDDQGVRLAGTGTDAAMVSYVAHITFASSSVPGSAFNTATGEPYMKRLVVKIANSTNPNYAFDSHDPSQYKTTSFLITKIQ
jgi:uncharacterized protein (TIGR02598 family)